MGNLINLGEDSAIKSRQFGLSTVGTADVAITISEVNPNKCEVLLNSLVAGSNDANVAVGDNVMLKSLTSDTLTIAASGMVNGKTHRPQFSWQVIEFN